LLLGQQANFLAFGSKARIDYANQDGMLFENFKMRLNDDHGGLEPVAEASNGNRVPLLKLITHSLKHIKDEAMAAINKSQVDCSLVRALFLCLCACSPLSLVLSSLFVSYSLCLSSLSVSLAVSVCVCVCVCVHAFKKGYHSDLSCVDCSGPEVESFGHQVGGNSACHLARCCKGDFFLHIFGFMQSSTCR